MKDVMSEKFEVGDKVSIEAVVAGTYADSVEVQVGIEFFQFPSGALSLVERAPKPLQVGDVLTAKSPRPPDGTIYSFKHGSLGGEEYCAVLYADSRWPLPDDRCAVTVERVGHREENSDA